MTERVPIGVLGRIDGDRETGRTLEIVDDRAASGGYLVLTHADFNRSGPSYDTWYSTLEEAEAAVEQWQVSW